MSDDNIILTGFMGTGKTTVGRLLAAQLGRLFVDTDDLIVGRDGRSIAAIFREDGEARFRELERQTAAELAGRRGLVIATGGGLMLDPSTLLPWEPPGRSSASQLSRLPFWSAWPPKGGGRSCL